MPWSAQQSLAAAQQIALLALDVDGVLTDGGLIIGPEGAEWKRFHARDGHAIKLAQAAGLRVAVISGRTAPVVDVRCRELGIEDVEQGAADKWEAMQRVLARRSVEPRQAAFMGDDVVDLPVMLRVGLSMAPHDAAPEVLDVCGWRAARSGGHGAVADAIRYLLRASGRWEAVLALYRKPSEEARGAP